MYITQGRLFYTGSQRLESHMMTTSHGLKRKDELMGLRPCRTVEPPIDIVTEIVHSHLKLPPDEIAQTTVNCQFEGAFNKLFAIECQRGSFVMRFTLPVDPHFKTLSEVTTVQLLESKTSVPVPQIIASDYSGKNKLGSS